MKKPLALVAALLVLAPALAFAAPAAAGKIYWTNAKNGAVGRANLDGTHVDRRFIRGAETRWDVAVNAAHVYWTTRRGIGRSNLNGGALDLGFITGGDRTYGVAVDGAHVYWASEQPIGRADLDGMGVDQGFITPARDALRGGGRLRTRLLGPQRDRARQPRRHGGGGALHHRPAVPLRAGGERPARLLVRPATLIGRANLDGTHVDKRFITRAGDPCGVAVNGRHVYWTINRPAGNAIGRARLNGTHMDRRFITGMGRPVGLAVGPG